MLVRTFLVSLVFLLNGAVQADAPIDGAFGIKFGTTLDQLKVDRTLANGVVHVVTPPIPLNMLTLYSVETDNKTGKVYRIAGQTMANDKSGCMETLASLIGVLEEKYGEFSSHGTMFRLKSGDKSITATCTSERGFTQRQVYMVKVLYEDLALTQTRDAL